MSRTVRQHRRHPRISTEELAQRIPAALWELAREECIDAEKLIAAVAPGISRGRLYRAMPRAVRLSAELYPGWVISVGDGYRMIDEIDSRALTSILTRQRQAASKSDRDIVELSVAADGTAAAALREAIRESQKTGLMDQLEKMAAREAEKVTTP